MTSPSSTPAAEPLSELVARQQRPVPPFKAPEPEAVRLKDLIRLQQPVELPSGRKVLVRPMSYRMRQLAREIDATSEGAAQDALFFELARLCVPDITDEEFGELDPIDMTALIAISGGNVELVTASLYPPAPETSTEPPAADPAGAEGNAVAPALPDPAAAGALPPDSRRRSKSRTPSST